MRRVQQIINNLAWNKNVKKVSVKKIIIILSANGRFCIIAEWKRKI